MLKERRLEVISWADGGLNDMTWLGWLGLTVIVASILVVTGIKSSSAIWHIMADPAADVLSRTA